MLTSYRVPGVTTRQTPRASVMARSVSRPKSLTSARASGSPVVASMTRPVTTADVFAFLAAQRTHQPMRW